MAHNDQDWTKGREPFFEGPKGRGWKCWGPKIFAMEIRFSLLENLEMKKVLDIGVDDIVGAGMKISKFLFLHTIVL